MLGNIHALCLQNFYKISSTYWKIYIGRCAVEYKFSNKFVTKSEHKFKIEYK